MFSQLINQITIDLEIKPEGPVLIKSSDGGAGKDIMRFVRTWRNGRQEVFLPGSSLKGALRAYAERLARTLRSDSVCNPFNSHYHKPQNNPSPWGVPNCHFTFKKFIDHLENKGTNHKAKRQALNNVLTPETFKVLCPACQLFGSLLCAGHVSLSDAYLVDRDQTREPEIRDGVAIDRFSGGTVGKAKFMFEGQIDGVFKTTLSAQNLAWWQVAWLGLVLRDLQDGFLPLGMGSSRGFGKVDAELTAMQIDILRPEPLQAGAPLPCLVSLQPSARAYGFEPEPEIYVPEGVEPKQHGLRQRYEFSGEQANSFLQAQMPSFWQRLQHRPLMQDWRREHRLGKGLGEEACAS